MLGGISIWQLLIVLVIIVLIFGTKKLRNVGGDLGGALKNFKKAVKDEEAKAVEQQGSDAEFSSSESVDSKEESAAKNKD